MAKLIIKLNDAVIDQIPVRQGDMAIGRQRDSEIVLENLAVSGRHATIFTVGEDSFIQDLNSTNGTFINNRRIAKAHLKNGDIITVGKHSLIYLNDNAGSAVSDLAKTVVLRPDPADAAMAPPPVAAAVAPAAGPLVAPPAAERQQGMLYVLSGANSGKRIELTRSLISLGSGGRKAGLIRRNSGGGYRLLPGELDEAPRLNGAPVPSPGQELQNGDIIEIAGARMQFYLR